MSAIYIDGLSSTDLPAPQTKKGKAHCPAHSKPKPKRCEARAELLLKVLRGQCPVNLAPYQLANVARDPFTQSTLKLAAHDF